MDKLAGVHPTLVIRVRCIMEAMRALGFPMIVTDGVRTVEQQQALYAQGRTAAGNVVTNVDGIKVRSNHQPHEDGWGHAVDMTFLDKDGRPTWNGPLPWNLYGEMAKALGLRWGGDWKALIDRPHVELPDSATVNA